MKRREIILAMTMIVACVGFTACGAEDSSKEAATKMAEVIKTEVKDEEDISITETEETEEISTELVITDEDLVFDESGIYARNKKLENAIYENYKDETTAVVQYSEARQTYRYFSVEQLESYNELCEKWVNGATEYKIRDEIRNVRQMPDSYDNTVSDINFVQCSFEGKNISMEELERLISRNGSGLARIPNYLFVRVIYDQEWDETKVYFVLAEGDWN